MAISIEAKYWLLLLSQSNVQTEKMLYNKAPAKEIPCLFYKSLKQLERLVANVDKTTPVNQCIYTGHPKH